jgi:hypothetical protein
MAEQTNLKSNVLRLAYDAGVGVLSFGKRKAHTEQNRHGLKSKIMPITLGRNYSTYSISNASSPTRRGIDVSRPGRAEPRASR